MWGRQVHNACRFMQGGPCAWLLEGLECIPERMMMGHASVCAALRWLLVRGSKVCSRGETWQGWRVGMMVEDAGEAERGDVDPSPPCLSLRINSTQLLTTSVWPTESFGYAASRFRPPPVLGPDKLLNPCPIPCFRVCFPLGVSTVREGIPGGLACFLMDADTGRSAGPYSARNSWTYK